MGRQRKLTTKRKQRDFLKVLAGSGNVTTASEAVGISRRTAQRQKKVDPEFSTAWDDALAELGDKVLQAVLKRATAGEPVEETTKYYTYNNEGTRVLAREKVVNKVHKSDSQLWNLALRFSPGLQKPQQIEVTGKDGDPIKVDTSGYDLSKLSYDELIGLQEILAKATPDDVSGAGAS